MVSKMEWPRQLKKRGVDCQIQPVQPTHDECAIEQRATLPTATNHANATARPPGEASSSWQ